MKKKNVKKKKNWNLFKIKFNEILDSSFAPLIAEHILLFLFKPLMCLFNVI